MRRPAVTCTLAVVVLGLVSGAPAQAAKKSRTPVMSSIEGLEISPQELRIRVRALIRPTLGITEEAADRMLRDASDPVVRRGVLRWKIETTGTLLSAMLRNDPVLALADAWGYVLQVRALLERPEAKTVYGEYAARASDALVQAETEFRAFWEGVQANRAGDDFEARVRRWAENHPIGGALYRRPSMDNALAELLATGEKGGALAALGNLDETTADVMTRMDLYTLYLPRLARWEAELAVDDLARGVDPKDLVTELERFTKAVDRIAAVAEGTPGLVERERAAALEALQAERVAATQDLRGERRAVVDALRQERIATLTEIEAMTQRLAERSSGPVRQAVHQEMKDLIVEVEAMRGRLIDDIEVAMNGVVDHAFMRGLQFLLIVAVLGGAGFALYTRLFRR